MKKISNSLNQKIKKFIQIIFKLIYGNINHDIKKISSEKIKICETKILKKISNEGYKVCEINKGRIYTDFVENVAVIEKNTILEPFSYQTYDGKYLPYSENTCVKKGTPRIKKYFKGNILNLTQGASGHSNYFHWLFDILPKIKIFSELHDLSSIDYFYLDYLKPYQKNILKLMGLENINIISANKHRHVQADKIFATEHPWYFKGLILEEVNNMPDWIIEWLNEKFLKFANNFNAGEKIYIDRSESSFKHCQFKNENEISRFLLNKGFVKYKVGNLSFEDQIFLFNNAKVIFGAHGAAFANLIFCKKDTKVIEVKPEYHPNKISKKIAKINKLDLSLIETKELQNKENGDIELDINILNNLL